MTSSSIFKKTALVTAITAALVGCGSGGSGGSTSSTTTTGTSATISGTAAKGIMIGADVVVYNATSDAVLAETTTNDKGTYSASLPAGFEGEVRVEVTANTDSLMVCDLTSCGDGEELNRDGTKATADVDGGDPDGTIEFGEVYKPGSGLKLKVLTKASAGDGTVTANATPLTTMAANYAEANNLTAAEANATIALQAGLTTIALDRLEVVDITDAASKADATDDALNAAITSAAIVEASGGIEEFAKEDSNATSYDVVYSSESPLDLSTASSALNTVAGTTATVDNTVDEVTIPTDVDLDGLSKAQAFVEQVRNFEVYSNRVDQNVAAFEDAISTIVANVDGDTNTVAEEMTSAIGAITAAIDYVLNLESDVESFEEKLFDGIPVSYDANTGTYNVKATTDAASHDITATTSVTEADTIDAKVTLSGKSASDTVTIELAEGSGLSLIGLAETEENNTTPQLWDGEQQGENNSFSTTSKLASVKLDLSVVITDSDDNSFTGAFAVALTGFDEADSNSYNSNDVDSSTTAITETSTWSSSTKIESGSITLKGEFVSAKHGSQSASVTLSTEKFDESSNSEWTQTCALVEGTDVFGDCSSSNSWNDSFSANEVKAVITFGVDISGLTSVDSQVDVEATVTAMGSESESYDSTTGYTSEGEITGDAVVNVEYDGSMLNFAYKVGADSSTGSLTNHNGVKLALTEANDGSISGVITYDSIDYATVSENSAGMVEIKWDHDGKIETL